MNLAERRIPKFLSKRIHSLGSTEEKRKALEQFEIWKSSDITKDYILFLESKIEHLLREDEDKTDWLSLFHMKYKKAHDKGQRSILRFLLKDLN